jgi:Bacteriophage HK97-gp10, putative tail-component
MSIDKFKSAVKRMAEESFNEVGNHLQTYITEEKREYPRTTIRQEGVGLTGKIATTPRDVVDTGKLRDSFQMTTEASDNKVTVKVEWTADHAALVYSGTDKIPPYPWVQLGLREVDWRRLFLEKWKEVS